MEVAVVSVSYNTKELTALLLWSLYRVLEADDIGILVVDNASTDGSAELLESARAAGLCHVIWNTRNEGHGPALNQAMQTEMVCKARRVWILDSDCVITRTDALRTPLQAHPDAAIIGESHWDRWRGRMRHELYSLIIDPKALAEKGIAEFSEGGDPAWELLDSAKHAEMQIDAFPFAADRYLIHLGRGSLAAVAAAGDDSHPLHAWALEHHQPHFGGVEGAQDQHAAVLEHFRAEVGPSLDLAAAIRR